MSDFRKEFKDLEERYESVKKKTTAVTLKYLADRIAVLFNAIDDLVKDCCHAGATEITEEELHEALDAELEELKVPKTYVVCDILHRFVTGVVNKDIVIYYGNATNPVVFIDKKYTSDDLYDFIAGPGHTAAYAKRALTMLRKTVDLSKSKKFGFAIPSSSDSNDKLLCNMYQYLETGK